MLCTAAEIEEKKRIAKEKLFQKRNVGKPVFGTNNRPHTSSNLNAASSTSSSTDVSLHRQSTSFGNTAPRSVSTRPSSPVISKHFSMQKSFQQARANSPKGNSFQGPNVGNKQPMFSNDAKITATCILVTPNQFQVKLSKYFNVAIDLFRTIPSKYYDSKTCNWSFSLNDYDLLLTKLEALKSALVVNKLPPWIHLLQKSRREDTPCYDFSHIDEDLRDTLMPFQEESLCFAIERNGRCFIADEMGLGKTLQALAISGYYRQDWPVLIVTTASTCASWESTICKYMPSIPIMDVQLLSTKSDYIETPSVIITSYDMMTRRTDDLASAKCGICIFDESHILKNFKTKCFKSALSLSKIAKRVILLSGTPALSKPSELFTQLQLIDESFFGHFMEFSKRYCDGKESPFGWDSSGRSNLEELQIVLEQRFMIRRTKAGISALNLPDKIQEIVHLDMTSLNLNVDDKEELKRLQGTDFKKVIKNDSQILPYFHNTAKIKIPAVCSYISKLLTEEENKFIVFAHHMNMLDAVEHVVRQSKKEYIRIDGRTNDREALVRKFQTNDRVACALLSITAANSGITLTAARIVIFTELHWTPSILAQAEARAHRIGQTHPVSVRYLIAPNTVDDYIWPMLQTKQKTLIDMKLTSESYENLTTVEKPKSQTNSIKKYFSPTQRAREEPEMVQPNKIQKVDSSVIDDAFGDDDDEFDAFVSTFSTQKVVTRGGNADDVQQYEDLFNDGMDEFFKTVQY